MSAALHIGPREAAAEILALTLWGEAADRPVRAIEALAALVMNRVRRTAEPYGPAHWGRGVAGVCRAPFQFPCWNRNHPRHAALREVPPGDAALAICRRVAARALAGALRDPTGGATHFHDAAGLPVWALGRPAVAEIGGLCFYRAEDLA
ncbi:cell wall hydrolase [Roseomonas eburnea]|uniref:Cell wall hydrolase n=1 Tax=Neoroseomonas eburnea TaxID=1346889 RepID=A0A9X9X7I7_9PROT|nr:cell wall hydrolase [Neoroseomonas eburnea]MBR0679673.1 cell wall hydrolase [Neoroseomonas eburnea]